MRQLERFILIGCAIVGCGLSATWQSATGQSQVRGAEPAVREVRIIADANVHKIANALVNGDDLLVPISDVQAVTGFEAKPEGMCDGEVCYFPADASWNVERDGVSYFNLTKFAKKVGQVYAADPENNVWSFTKVPHPHTAKIVTGKAPDFALPDRKGNMIRLSDFRGKKVVLVTWASWCGCRYDVAGWQKVYEDLKDKGVEVISVAEDTGGAAAAEPWFAKGGATMTSLIDVDHTVSSLFQMVNVPTGVWIDEAGNIVRPPEVAYSKKVTLVPGIPTGDDRYAQGVRDWAEKGEKSEFVYDAKKLEQRLALRTPDQRMGEAEFKLATYFTALGNKDAAAKHYQVAQKLDPDNWNYHRQEWSFDPKSSMRNFMAKVQKLEGRPYYAPVEFPASTEEPAK